MTNKQINFKFQILNFKFFLLFFYLFISLFIYSGNVNAQQVSLSLSPPLLELFIKPGKSVLIAYKLENLGDPTIMKTKVLPFTTRDTLGNVRIKEEFEGPIRFSLDNSVIQLEDPFFMKTKDTQQLLLKIRVPEGAPEGDYYYTLLAETEPSPGTEGITSSQAKATIGSNILITVTESGKTETKGHISLFTVGKAISIFDSSDKIPVVLILENKGKNLLKPQGEIELRGNFGEKASYDILPQNILAESQRLISATPSAVCDCKIPISLLLEGFFIGKYSLSTTINFGEGSPNIFASTSFIALPFKFLAMIGLALGMVVVIIRRTRREE